MSRSRKPKLPPAPVNFPRNWEGKFRCEGVVAKLTWPGAGEVFILAPTSEALEFHLWRYGLRRYDLKKCRKARVTLIHDA